MKTRIILSLHATKTFEAGLAWDTAGQTTQIQERGPGDAVIAKFDLTYDPAGRVSTEATTPARSVFAEPAQTISHDADNRIMTFNSQQVTHDDDGNMTHGPGGGTVLPPNDDASCTYDSRNRLIGYGVNRANPFQWRFCSRRDCERKWHLRTIFWKFTTASEWKLDQSRVRLQFIWRQIAW